LRHVQVIFLPDEQQGTKGPRSTAITDEQGRFRLVCDNGQPGAVVGHHRVILFESARLSEQRGERGGERSAEAAPRNPDAPKNPPLPQEYKTAAATPVQREVKPGAQTIDLTLP